MKGESDDMWFAARLVRHQGGEWEHGLRELGASGEATPVSFYDFAGGLGSRIQSFFSFASGTPEGFGENLSLVAANRLTPQIGSESWWREVPAVAEDLRDRRVNGKAAFRVE